MRVYYGKIYNIIAKQIYDTKQHKLEELTVILPSKRQTFLSKLFLS